jgi:sugar (pentulose or hexulose) kinase
MSFLVSLDAGTGGGKCTVFDLDGRLLGAHRERWSYTLERNLQIPFVKGFSFEPEAMWQALCRCTRGALAQSGVDPRRIAGVAATSQREGCVFLDDAGQEIYGGPNLDARGFLEGMEVLQALGADRLHQITGHSAPFIFPIARYLWFRKHDQRRVAWLLMINDWLTYRLSGELSAEPSNATESMLFDLRARTWSQEILDLFEIPADILPRVAQSGTRIGSVTATAAEQCGLPAGTPVIVGGADTQCSLLGAGAIEIGDTAATLGTTTPVQVVVDCPRFDPAASMWSGCHVLPDRWVVESNAGDTGDAYQWLLELVAGDRPREERFALAEQWVVEQPEVEAIAFVGPSIFDLARMRPTKPGGFLFPFPTMHLRPDRGALVRAFFESVGYAIRANLEQIAPLTGGRPARLHLSGGMVRSRGLVKVIRDVTGLPLRVADQRESAALGCAVLIATGLHLHPDIDSAVAAMVRHHEEFPEPVSVARYDEGYARWRSLYASLEELSI